MFPIKHVRSLGLLDGTPESPQERRHKPRRTLLSPQEHETDPCTQNQLEMMPDPTSLAPEPSPVPYPTQLALLPLGNSRDSLRHGSQV